MEKGNVLVIGNSGVGKSTLINAVLGESCSVSATKELLVKEPLADRERDLPFRMIDTVGFEPSWIKTQRTIQEVKKWSEASAKEGNANSRINVIWFCVEGTSKRLFAETISNLSRATSMWTSVPIIVVITKSYSVPDREENRKMVYDAFVAQKRFSQKLKGIIPVVADTFVLNENAFAAPEGIEELVQLTNRLLPDGIRAAKDDVEAFKLNHKRVCSHGVVGAATAGAVAIGAAPVPIPDALILGPTELAMLSGIAHIYGIQKDNKSKELFESMVATSAVSTAAKSAITALKAIPGINIGASVLNAVVAGSLVAALGEAAIFAFEQVCLGKKTIDDIDWIKKVVESKLSNELVEKVNGIIPKLKESTDQKAIVKEILELFFIPKK